ncbi:MAG TPA: polysaccharide deacetylase family protein [Phototrophicaceae bacterium]|nr:polysaccharide deacetylase family protein [Phototrophicaceae bacterium]
MAMPKVAYLTIDDAPSGDMRQKIDFLAEKQIPVVWFCVGDQLAQRSDLVVYAIQKGGVIGNHTYSHPSCSTLEIETIYDEIRRTDALIDAVYHQAGVARPAKYFRFPYGDKGAPKPDFMAHYTGAALERKETIQAFLRAEGFTQPAFAGITYAAYQNLGWSADADWLWTYDCLEWSIHSSQPQAGITSLEAVFARMEETVPAGMRGLNTPGSDEIVLVHDHPETTPYFAAIIQRLLDKGLVFKAVA